MPNRRNTPHYGTLARVRGFVKWFTRVIAQGAAKRVEAGWIIIAMDLRGHRGLMNVTKRPTDGSHTLEVTVGSYWGLVVFSVRICSSHGVTLALPLGRVRRGAQRTALRPRCPLTALKGPSPSPQREGLLTVICTENEPRCPTAGLLSTTLPCKRLVTRDH